MATSEIIEALQALAHERHIDEFYLIERLEASLANSYKKSLKLSNDCRAIINRQTGKIYVYELVPEGEPDEETGEYKSFVERDVTPKDISRFAAFNAKGVIQQIVRESNRIQIYNEFKDRVGELISCQFISENPDFTIFKIREGVEAELPHYTQKKETKPGDDFNFYTNERPANERYDKKDDLKGPEIIKTVIIGVRNPMSDDPRSKGDQSRATIVVSRTHPDLIRGLFKENVPELYSGLMLIKSVAREPGSRSKVSVYSKEPGLDPVGACVGPKGSRVKAIVASLKNEQVDVIEWDKDPAKYVENALSPAKVLKVTVDAEHNSALVIVPDDQLTLAIGNKGQNARLAARLTGLRIDIRSSSFAGVGSSDVGDLMDLSVKESVTTCAHMSADGVRCRNHARAGSRYCGVHSKLEQ